MDDTTADQFEDLYDRTMQLYNAQQFAEALALLDREGARFPEQAPEVLYLRSCLAARTGQLERAEQLLAEAVDRGYWYAEPLIRQSPSWQVLQGRPEFERLAAISIARADAQAHE